jgi:hypothetical protein
MLLMLNKNNLPEPFTISKAQIKQQHFEKASRK